MKRHQSTSALLTLAVLTPGFGLLPTALRAQQSDSFLHLTAALPQAPRKLGPIDIDQFRTWNWNTDTNLFHFAGTVRIRYADPQTSIPTVLEAETVDYNLATGELKAIGNFTDILHPVPFRLTREDAGFTGRELTLNLKDGNGILTHGDLQTDLYHLTGERIEIRDGIYLVTHGSFTTCVRRHPDYHLTARDIRLDPGKDLKAHNITFYAGPTRLITLPYYKRSLSTKAGQPVPVTPSYNKHDGIGLHYQDSPISHPNELLHLDILANLRRAPTGYAAYQKDLGATADPSPPGSVISSLAYPLRGVLEEMSPPTFREYAENTYPEPLARRTTFYAVVQNQQFLYNRKYTDLSISRFPEIGVRLLNQLGSTHPQSPGDRSQDEDAAPLTAPHNFGFARDVRPVLDLTASLGGIEEFPAKTVAGRLGTRISLASTPFLIGSRLSARAGLTDWASLYSTGDTYNLFSPEVEFNYVMTRTSSLNAGYSFFTDLGNTPFLFDRRDVRQELRLSYHVSGPIGFGYITKLDIGRSRFYDSEVALTRNFDCMQIGLSYRLRSQSIGIIFSLLPPTRHARAKAK
ncbi:MAG: hypothetical protein JWN14_3458 [Chthonomonadales bacterium]|nr:hypothetical protein [Chthonomonadales bacterium]